MAPFNTPWSTFLAWIVTGFSVIIAIIWVFFDYKTSKRNQDKKR